MSNSRGTFANWAGACVVLQEGKRLSWKILRGNIPAQGLSSKYYMGYHPRECDVISRTFGEPEAFARAGEWCASFEGHEREIGELPKK